MSPREDVFAEEGLHPCFLDMEGTRLDQADVAILSIPFEGTASYGVGTSQGPAAILRAGPHLETFDEELGVELAKVLKIATLPPIRPEKGERPEVFLPRVRSVCMGLGLVPPFPLSFGGEHSITPAVLSGICSDLSDVTVVQIDAHADLRDEYDESTHNHACAMRRVLDLGVCRLLSIGVRSCTEEEYALARDDDRIATWYAHQIQDAQGYEALLQTLRSLSGRVYLSVDIDGLDLPLSPGTGTPQPGGLSWYQATEIARAILRESDAEVFGADVVETVPQSGSQVNELVAAKLGLKILAYRFVPR